MERIATIIKTKFPNYAKLANEAFDIDYGDKWNKPMYQGNEEFKRIKQMYGNLPLTRDVIIFDLFKQGKYFDGFLCAMVWGNIGTYQGGWQRFEDIFNESNKEKINRVVELVRSGDVEKAYLSLCDKTQNGNGIKGLGEAFFTKLLYFAGMSRIAMKPKPLIFDRNIRIAYNNILSILGEKPHKGAFNRYWDYCTKMDELCFLLKLPTAGHVEALLFKQEIRDSLL